LFAAPLFSRFTHPPLPSVRKDTLFTDRGGWARSQSLCQFEERETNVIVNVKNVPKLYTPKSVNSTLVQYSNGAANMAAPL
jgi:hypothetical protein